MHVSFLVNPLAHSWSPNDNNLKGTERGVVEWADELRKRDHQVTIYTNETRDSYAGGEDICINIKSYDIAPLVPTIYYTNDVDADKQDLSAYDAVVHISSWAKDNIFVNNPNVFVVPHGYDPKQYYPGTKIPQRCLYSSSPDRGLDTLLRAWQKVYPFHPNATLVVTYGAEEYDIPGVTFSGDVPEEEMAQLYRESDIWCHPANGGELQCIAGMKAQAAGCWPVVIPAMALSETVKYGTFADKDNYAEKLIEALSGHPERSDKGITIEESTDKLLSVIQWVLDGRNNSRKPT